MGDYYEIQPASLLQVQEARGGGYVAIDDDVQGVANRLREIDPGLRLRLSKTHGHFVIFHVETTPQGEQKEKLVTTAKELDHRLIKRIEEIASESYDYVAEVEAVEAEANRVREHQFSEDIAEGGEKLAWALRKDLDVQNRIFVPRSW